MKIHPSEFLDTLTQGHKDSGAMEGFKCNRKSISAFPERNLANGFKPGDPISDHPDPNPSDLAQSSGVSSVVDSTEEHDFNDAILKYISQMLMEEEDLVHKPCMFQHCLALQAAEKSFYDVLGEKYPSSTDPQHPPPVLDQNANGPIDNFTSTCSSHSINSSTAVDKFVESNRIRDRDKFESSLVQSSRVDRTFDSILQSFGSSVSFLDAGNRPVDSLVARNSSNESQVQGENPMFTQCLQYNDYINHQAGANGLRGKKNHYRGDSDCVEAGRSHKQLASFAEDSDDQSEMYDKVLLCPLLNPHLHQESALFPFDDASHNDAKLQQHGGSNRGRPRGKKRGNKREVVDLRTLLTLCAQAVAGNDGRAANELLRRIRQHSSPYGDGTQRMAHFFANALEARLLNTGIPLYTAFASSGITATDMLKGYQVFIKASPFKLYSKFFANRSIRKLSKEATRLHVIDFGILYGFQWPGMIQHLSVRPGGPPKLRITGIELPQRGFRPAERVEETGRRLANYCERFNVPFEYNAIAKKWDTIRLEDLRIDRDEALVVNCIDRLKNVPDETVVLNMNSPRDAVLNLIKRINPDLFVHGVVNGTYSAPFFVTRFREALFHFSALFDMLEANVQRADRDRMLLEREIFGRIAMNVIACEGSERVERPETYKQWQVRNVRAGFRQLPLDQELVKEVRARVKLRYNKDFEVDEDGNWMLQGWKGRIISAISCWKPAQNHHSLYP